MKQETDLQALQLEVDEVLRGLASMQHFLQPASRVQRMESIERTEATFWVDGQPARPLASFLHPLQAALRLSLVDAAAELLIPVIEGDGAPLLVLHPVMPVERLDAYARRCGANRGWGIAGNHSYACDDGQPANGLRLNLSPVPPTADEAARVLADAARGATDALATYWLDCLKAGRVDRLDSPPGLPCGAVLGVLEVDTAKLWPVLSAKAAQVVELRPIHGRSDANARQAMALEKCDPPADFVKGRTWSDAHKVVFIGAYDELIAAGMGKDAALCALASKGWANSGSTLTKRITEGNEARRKVRAPKAATRKA